MTDKEIQRFKEYLLNNGQTIGFCYFYIYPDKREKLNVFSESLRIPYDIKDVKTLYNFLRRQPGGFKEFLKKNVYKITIYTYIGFKGSHIVGVKYF